MKTYEDPPELPPPRPARPPRPPESPATLPRSPPAPPPDPPFDPRAAISAKKNASLAVIKALTERSAIPTKKRGRTAKIFFPMRPASNDGIIFFNLPRPKFVSN